jgi:hypothetical protein
MWYGRKPDISHFRIFGSPVTSRIVNHHLNKIENRGESGIFLGYAPDSKGYIVWFPSKRQFRIRRDVIFHDLRQSKQPLPVPNGFGQLWDDVIELDDSLVERETRNNEVRTKSLDEMEVPTRSDAPREREALTELDALRERDALREQDVHTDMDMDEYV